MPKARRIVEFTALCYYLFLASDLLPRGESPLTRRSAMATRRFRPAALGMCLLRRRLRIKIGYRRRDSARDGPGERSSTPRVLLAKLPIILQVTIGAAGRRFDRPPRARPRQRSGITQFRGFFREIRTVSRLSNPRDCTAQVRRTWTPRRPSVKLLHILGHPGEHIECSRAGLEV